MQKQKIIELKQNTQNPFFVGEIREKICNASRFFVEHFQPFFLVLALSFRLKILLQKIG